MRDQSLVHALSLLPPALRSCFREEQPMRMPVEEIRLRAGRPIMVSAAGLEREVPGSGPVTAAQLRQVMENVTGSSLHSAAESLKHGYVTASGGCRVGICGTAAVSGGAVGSIREISSLCIRVAREQPGIAAPLLHLLNEKGRILNTIVISPPGFGKTTLLRDMVRLVSDRGIRVALADERGELAAVTGGVPRFDVGAHTDVMTGAPKEYAVMTLLRTMTPHVIALDEISEACDARAVALAANCGTAIFATVHGYDRQDVLARPVLAEIRARGIFRRAVTIRLEDGKRSFLTEAI